MRLFIAEKPIQGETIAMALNRNAVRRSGYFECGPQNDPMRDVVTWANGHLYKLAEWEDYDPALNDWARFDLLPVRPPKWELVPDKHQLEQIGIINNLVMKAEIIVHCCDLDREGQFIGNVVIEKALEAAREAGRTTMPQVLRLCNIDGNSVLDEMSIEDALKNLRPNDEEQFVNLGRSAFARAIGDQIVGFSFSRKCTIDGKRAGWRQKGPISVGRVQTPTLKLIVQRDREIENFRPKAYYTLTVQYDFQARAFATDWKPSEDSGLLDADKHITDKSACEKMLQKLAGLSARVFEVENTPQKEMPPLPHSLSSLQIQASEKRFGGLTAKEVLSAAQRLYERFRLITYPRTNCRHLPTTARAQALATLHAIAHNHPVVAHLCGQAQPDNPDTNAFDDKAVTTHHAIIPRANTNVDMNLLTSQEKVVYDLICRAYITQFFPPARYERIAYKLTAGNETMVTSERRTRDVGWRTVYGAVSRGVIDDILPDMAIGDTCRYLAGEVRTGHTDPPQPYTDGTLIKAMVNTDQFVADEKLKKMLKGVEGIGTDATRDDIIETLIERGYALRQGRYLRSTRKGGTLVDSLPDDLCSPGLTAIDEYALKRIVDGAFKLDDFVDHKITTVKRLLPLVHMKPGTLFAAEREASDAQQRNGKMRRRHTTKTA